VATSSRANPWRRVYPEGALFSGVVGFSSTVYNNWALEAQYNNYLEAHTSRPELRAGPGADEGG